MMISAIRIDFRIYLSESNFLIFRLRFALQELTIIIRTLFIGILFVESLLSPMLCIERILLHDNFIGF